MRYLRSRGESASRVRLSTRSRVHGPKVACTLASRCFDAPSAAAGGAEMEVLEAVAARDAEGLRGESEVRRRRAAREVSSASLDRS